jgi:hypothetical protein
MNRGRLLNPLASKAGLPAVRGAGYEPRIEQAIAIIF